MTPVSELISSGLAADSGRVCLVRRSGWAAVDVEAERRLEAPVSRKSRWRESLFAWLIEFNRY